ELTRTCSSAASDRTARPRSRRSCLILRENHPDTNSSCVMGPGHRQRSRTAVEEIRAAARRFFVRCWIRPRRYARSFGSCPDLGADAHVQLGGQRPHRKATFEAQLFDPARKSSRHEFQLRHGTWTPPAVAHRRRGNSSGGASILRTLLDSAAPLRAFVWKLSRSWS